MYDNQKEIDRIEKQIQQISPELRVSGLCVSGNRAVNADITIPVKGNGTVIKKLEELGWRKIYRKKVRADKDKCARCQYKGYIMHQIMQFDFNI